MLGYIDRSCATRLHQVLRSPLRSEGLRQMGLLRRNRPDRYLVHMDPRRLDQYVPSAWRMQASEQEVLHHYRLVARLLQQCHSLRSATGCICSPAFGEKEVVLFGVVPSGMLVGQALLRNEDYLTDSKQLHYCSRPTHGLRD
jgi:hypothetical protein